MSAENGSPRAGSRPTNPTAAATVTVSTASGNRRQSSSAAGPVTSSASRAGAHRVSSRHELRTTPLPAGQRGSPRIGRPRAWPPPPLASTRPATAVIPLIVITRLRP